MQSLFNIVTYNDIAVLFRIKQLLRSKSKTMLKTFNAILKNNSIQWLDETPTIEIDSSVKVHVTLLEEITINQTKSNGQKMAKALSKISKNGNFANVDPQKWQQENRHDRDLPNRD